MNSSRGSVLQQDIWLGNLLRCSAYHVSSRIQELSINSLPPEPSFVDAKVEVSRLDEIHHLERLGFRLVDTNLQLSLKQISCLSRSALKACRWATTEDEAEVTEIASKCFTYSRFHLDPHIPNSIANQIKASWAKNYFKGERGDWMVVAVVNGKVVGFLQLLLSNENHLIIDLLAVAPTYRGQGLGRAMIDYAACNCLPSLQKIQVGTQIVNTPALNLYRSMGFEFEQAEYILHLHIGLYK